ncbi:hypothetical protein [Actinotalea solisilvae]|uniref:hypothetical protein n=1 Tax=Actinotalea solisilvae TaxID=2072922 RepID=UPI0018F11AFE|nr:hypothetical protein [Actinotalea solisilvae]
MVLLYSAGLMCWGGERSAEAMAELAGGEVVAYEVGREGTLVHSDDNLQYAVRLPGSVAFALERCAQSPLLRSLPLEVFARLVVSDYEAPLILDSAAMLLLTEAGASLQVTGHDDREPGDAPEPADVRTEEADERQGDVSLKISFVASGAIGDKAESYFSGTAAPGGSRAALYSASARWNCRDSADIPPRLEGALAEIPRGAARGVETVVRMTAGVSGAEVRFRREVVASLAGLEATLATFVT